MAILEPGRASSRPLRLKGVVNIIARGGRLFAQAWPKKRGPHTLPWMKANRDRLIAIQKAIQFMPTAERGLTQQTLKQYLAKHQGLRGTAAIRERDYQTAMISGRLWATADPYGTKITPVTVCADASDFLDWIEPRIGSMMVRTETGWLPTENCAPGKVLVQTLVPDWPGACPPASIPDAADAMGGF